MRMGYRWLLVTTLSLGIGCTKEAPKAPTTENQKAGVAVSESPPTASKPQAKARSAAEGFAFRGGPTRSGSQPNAEFDARVFESVGAFRTSNEVRSSPVLVDGVAYFGGSDGYFYALHLASGVKRWSVGAPNGMYAAPAIVEDTVYVGTLNGKFRALSRDTGAELWSFIASKGIYSSPVVHEGIVYFGSVGGFVYALNAKSGKEVWKVKLGGDVYASPTVVDGRVYIGSWDKALHALDAATGKGLWSFKTGNQIFATAAYDSGMVYVSSWDHVLYALDAKSGAKRWQAKLGDVSRSSPAVSGQTVVVGCDDQQVYAFDKVSGEPRWQFKTDGPVYSSPTIAGAQNGPVVLIGSNDGSLYALRLKDGTLVGKHKTYGKVTSTPFAAEGRVIVGSYDNGLYVFGSSGLSNVPPKPSVVGNCSPARTRHIFKRYAALDGAKGLTQYRDVTSSHHSGHYSITRHYDGDQLGIAHINAGHESMDYSEYHYFDGRDLIMVLLDVNGAAEEFYREIFYASEGRPCGCRERARDEETYKDVPCAGFKESFKHIQYGEASGGLWREDDMIRHLDEKEREQADMGEDKYDEAMEWCRNQGADDSQIENCVNDYVGNYE